MRGGYEVREDLKVERIDSFIRRGSFIDAFRQNSDIILELQEIILKLQKELVLEKKKKKCCC